MPFRALSVFLTGFAQSAAEKGSESMDNMKIIHSRVHKSRTEGPPEHTSRTTPRGEPTKERAKGNVLVGSSPYSTRCCYSHVLRRRYGAVESENSHVVLRQGGLPGKGGRQMKTILYIYACMKICLYFVFVH